MEGSLIDDKREKHSISKSEIHSIFPTLPYLVNLHNCERQKEHYCGIVCCDCVRGELDKLTKLYHP